MIVVNNFKKGYTVYMGNASAIKYLIYWSKPFGFDQNMLDTILMCSQTNNKDREITGALISRSDLFLQYLEGPSLEIDLTYNKIVDDDRHVEVTLLNEGTSCRRLFASWAMRDDPVKSWMWTRDEIREGILNTIGPDDALNIFKRHSREVDQFL